MPSNEILKELQVDYLMDINKQYLAQTQKPSQQECDESFNRAEKTIEYLVSIMIEPPNLVRRALYVKSGPEGQVEVKDIIRLLMRC